MTDKQRRAIDKLTTSIPVETRRPFTEAAEYAMSLGYMPVLKGARETYVDFIKNKINKIIMKIDVDPKFPARIAMQFYALPEYTGIFKQAVEDRVDLLKNMGYEAGCYECGKCDGTVGYKFKYAASKTGFMCGRGVVTLPSFGADNVAEVKAALKIQDDHFTGK